jgi:hypothetical protein
MKNRDTCFEPEVAAPARKPFRTQTATMGQPAVDLDRALQVAASLEDDEFVSKSWVIAGG